MTTVIVIFVWANEIDEHACATYSHNFDHTLVQGDIEKIVKPEREESADKRNEYIEKQELINPNRPILYRKYRFTTR